jgi:thioredoxin 1
MLDRLILTFFILGGLALLWLGCCYARRKVVQSIEPVDVAPGVPTLLYFSADYCAPCQLQQTPIVDELTAKLGEAVVVKKYDVTQHPELASQYKVLTLPTTIVLNPEGQVAHLNYGVTSRAKLEAQLG